MGIEEGERRRKDWKGDWKSSYKVWKDGKEGFFFFFIIILVISIDLVIVSFIINLIRSREIFFNRNCNFGLKIILGYWEVFGICEYCLGRVCS